MGELTHALTETAAAPAAPSELLGLLKALAKV